LKVRERGDEQNSGKLLHACGPAAATARCPRDSKFI